jgi:hypothetical protein
VLWLPPVIEQATHRPGNMVEIWRYFMHGGETHSFLEGIHAVYQQLSATPQWLTGSLKVEPFNGGLLLSHGPLPLLLLPFAAVTIILARVHARKAVLFAGTVTVGLVCAVVAVRQVVGPLYEYRVRWISVLGMATALVIMWGAWIWLSSKKMRLVDRTLVCLVSVGIAALSTINAAEAATASTPDAASSKALGSLTQQLLASLPPGKGAVLVRSEPSFGSKTYYPGIVLQLESHGIQARVPEGGQLAFGEHRVYHAGPLRAVLSVAADADFDRLRAQRGYQLLAQMGEADRTTWEQGQALLKAAYDRGSLTAEQWMHLSAAVPKATPAIGVFMSRDPKP